MPYEIVDEIFNSGFEEEAELITAASGSSQIDVVFDEEFDLITLNIGYEGVATTALCKADEVIGATQNDTFVIRDKEYKISERHPFGDGLILFILKY